MALSAVRTLSRLICLLLLLVLPALMLLPKFTLTVPVATPSTSVAASGPSALATIWLLGFTLFGLAQLRSHVALRRWMREARTVQDPRVLDLLEDCRLRLGLRPSIGLAFHPDLGSPAVAGLRRPLVFLPCTASA